MTENKKDVPQTVHDTLFLPTLIQESLLPLRTGPKKATRKYRDVDITVRAGAFQGRDLVLPAGAIARKLFHFLVTTANRHNSPRVDLVSMNHLIRTIGVTKSAKTVKRIKEELLCLSRMTIDVDRYKNIDGIESAMGVTERVISKFSLNGVNQDGQLSLFGSWMELSPEFWERLQRHKFQPVMREAVWALSKPLAIDVYLWLQRRCQGKDVTDAGKLIRWADVQEQFGRKGDLHQLKRDMTSAIDAAAPKLIRHGWDNKKIVKITEDGLVIRPIPRQAQTEQQSSTSESQMLWGDAGDTWQHPEPKRVVLARRKKRDK